MTPTLTRQEARIAHCKFLNGKRTDEIAKIMRTTEAHVANSLAHLREEERVERLRKGGA
jgi:DNA-binding transcriptional regulator LsrR (DeoR family)